MTPQLLTYSALNTFRNCPRKFKLRFLDGLAPREKAESLAFGSVIHEALQKWYALRPGEPNRFEQVIDQIDRQFPGRHGDATQKRFWRLARALFTGYAARYAQEEFEAVEIEKEFQCEIHNPETGRASQTFRVAGKVDGIVRLGGEHYLLEHKTASSLDGNYLDKLWTDTQIALYSHYLRQVGYPIVGVIYNVLLKARLEQRAGESEAEFQARKAVLAAKNKTGSSKAKRQEPESDEAFEGRLQAWYARPEAFHRECIYLSEERLSMLQEEVWEVTQQYLDAKRRGKWLLNTSNCFSFQRPCEYLPYCQSCFNPHVAANLYDVRAPHQELSLAAQAAASF